MAVCHQIRAQCSPPTKGTVENGTQYTTIDTRLIIYTYICLNDVRSLYKMHVT